MRNFFVILSCLLSVTAIVLVAGDFWMPSLGSTTDDFVAILVSVLGVLVTFVLGYQIYSTIDMRQRVEKFESLDKKVEGAETKLNNLRYEIMSDMYLNLGVMLKHSDNPSAALNYYVRGLDLSLKCNDIDRVEELLDRLDNELDCYDHEKDPNDTLLKSIDAILDSYESKREYRVFVRQFRQLRDKLDDRLKDNGQ